MPRPRKVGLDYFPEDVDRRNDFKIMDLLNEYGPLGYVVYDFCLQYIYANGYFLDVPLSQVVLLLVKDIGAKWIKNKDLVLQVIYYCADIGLFDHALLQQNIMTSVGIQRRYNEVTVRNKVDKTKYWLLDKKNKKSDVAVISASETPENVAETPENVAETPENVAETPQKKSKVNERKVKINKVNNIVPVEIKDAFSAYVEMRKKIKKPLTDYAIELAIKKLETLAPGNYQIQIAILNQSIERCWQGLFPLKEDSDSGINNRNGSKNEHPANQTGPYI